MVKNFGVISKEELEAGRKYLRRVLGKEIRVEVVIKAFLPKTKKPAEVRMGKGKGKINSFISPIRAGQVIYNLHGFILVSRVMNVISNLSKKFSKDLFVIPKNALFQRFETVQIYKKEYQKLSFYINKN